MKECEDCIYSKRSPDDEPCYQCLSSYIDKPNFKKRKKEDNKEVEDNV